MSRISIFWHRRDLRLADNAGLYHALRSGYPVRPLFIFDRHILDDLVDEDDARVTFIHQEIGRLQQTLRERGSGMLIRYGKPEEVWRELLQELDVASVYTNRDYEPYAQERDNAVRALLGPAGISFHTYKDQVILEAGEVLKSDGEPYTVFTPYSRKWRETLASRLSQPGGDLSASFYLQSYPVEKYLDRLAPGAGDETPSLDSMGFQVSGMEFPSRTVAQSLIRNYGKTRNFPAIEGTSRLGVHFRFGTISIREKARKAVGLNDTYLNELIWRDFYSMILAHFPRVVDQPFREKYSRIDWRNREEEFERWRQGRTGYPLVDAGMRELNATGYMHNRVRMVVASFLTKHLLIDWRWGEAYFARKLLDYDLASNNGGWQWAAGCGTDAAPYFRIFNPASQLDKFDRDRRYVKKWVPEYETAGYPAPIVDHREARERCLEVFKEALNG